MRFFQERMQFTMVLGVALMVSGCSGFGLGSSEYSCSGIPQGVQCQSAREVYLKKRNGQELTSEGQLVGAAISRRQPILGAFKSQDILHSDLRARCRKPDVMLLAPAPYVSHDGVGHSGDIQLVVIGEGGCGTQIVPSSNRARYMPLPKSISTAFTNSAQTSAQNEHQQ